MPTACLPGSARDITSRASSALTFSLASTAVASRVSARVRVESRERAASSSSASSPVRRRVSASSSALRRSESGW